MNSGVDFHTLIDTLQVLTQAANAIMYLANGDESTAPAWDAELNELEFAIDDATRILEQAGHPLA